MKKIIVSMMIVVSMFIMSSCSIIKKDAPIAETEVISEEQPTLAQVDETSQPEPTEISNPVTGAEPTSDPTAEPEEEIAHTDIPGEPIYTAGQKVNDCNTGERIELGATTLIGSGCDVWTKAKFERPANAVNGDYIAALDIIRANMGSNQSWMFGKIELYNTALGNLPGDLVVGFEIDTEINSRGNFLILASGLNSTEWSTSGVQVWQDQNGDVGGSKPQSPDGKVGDGYETLVFDSGRGEDPDLAWVRVSPTDGASIEFAFKNTLLPSNQVFAWWAWTAQGNLDPAKMEFVDSLSEIDLWRIDNTCSWIYNGRPTNILTNICDFVMPTAIPSPTPTLQASQGHNCPPGEVWAWYPPGNRYMCLDPNPN